MSTPTSFAVPDLSPDALNIALEREAQIQREATPPSTFTTLTPTQPFDYLCEIEHDKYIPQEVDTMRMSIGDDYYWEFEARFWCQEYTQRIWEQSLEKHRHNAVSGSDALKSMACEYIRRLKRQGMKMEQIREKRRSIEDQTYWKSEAARFREISAAKEEALIVDFARGLKRGRNNPRRHVRGQATLAREGRRSARVSKRVAAGGKVGDGHSFCHQFARN